MNTRIPGKVPARLTGYLVLPVLSYALSWCFFASYSDLRPFAASHLDSIASRFCDKDVLLLELNPENAFSPSFVKAVISALQAQGCVVDPASPANLKKYQNPAPTNRASLAGATRLIISVGGPRLDQRPRPWHTELTVGWAKGMLNGGGWIVKLYWNGIRWAKKGDGAYLI